MPNTIITSNSRAQRYRQIIATAITLAGISCYPRSVHAATKTSLFGLLAIGSYDEMWSLTVYALKALSGHSTEWYTTLLGAALLAALCWWAASGYSRLWNLRFRITLRHHVFCFLAASLTFVFGVLFVGLRYTREAAQTSIDLWHAELLSDSQWKGLTFSAAYEAVKALGVEDFSGSPPPETGGHRIPLTKPESIATAASIFANSAAMDFRQRRPFLSKVLSARAEIPQEKINEAVKKFFDRGGTIYELEHAVGIAGADIKNTLQGQTGRIVPITRTCLVALFILVQLIPFGLIGLAAFNDLKVTT